MHRIVGRRAHAVACRHAAIVAVVAAVSLLVSGCSPASATHGGSSAPTAITVYAAASLTAAFRDLAAAYATATRMTVTLSFDASSALEAKIEQGAPADV